MNSEEQRQAERTLDRMLALLDEEILQRQIDRPIDHAANSFHHDPGPDCSNAGFSRLLTEFVTHLHTEALPLPTHCPPGTALAEARTLLEAGYRNPDGYSIALLDFVVHGSDATDQILPAIANGTKMRQRQAYIASVFARHLPLDWASRSHIAEIFQGRNRSYLPPPLRNWPPARLAEVIENLIRDLVASESQLRSALARDHEIQNVAPADVRFGSG